MIKTTQKSFILYQNYKKIFSRLSMEQRGQLISAIFDYNEKGSIDVELDEVCDIAFLIIQDTLDRDREAYEEKCRKNLENAKKGGRPRKNFFDQNTDGISENPKKPYNDNENDNVNENKNDNVIDNGSGSVNDNDNMETSSASTSATTTSTTLSREKIKDLEAEGINERYIEEVRGRAEYYASVQRMDVCDLVRQWWQSDRSNPKWQTDSGGNTRAKDKEKEAEDDDLEEWFEQRLIQLYGS